MNAVAVLQGNDRQLIALTREDTSRGSLSPSSSAAAAAAGAAPYSVRHVLRSLHGGNVGVHKDDLQVVFLECFYRLRARIVKLPRLANAEASTPYKGTKKQTNGEQT